MYSTPISDPRIVACPDCDLLQRLPELAEGASARCARCASELWRRRTDPIQRSLALSLAAAALFVIANAVPMLGLEAVGRRASTTVFGGVVQLWNDDRPFVAVLVLLTAIAAPALQIGTMLVISVAAGRPRVPHWIGPLLRHHPTARIWSMIEVMLVGVLVALIKIADYATVVPGLSLFLLGALVFLLAGIQASFDPRLVWARIEWASERDRHAAAVEATP
jgi:paraquat-inducible protein A